MHSIKNKKKINKAREITFKINGDIWTIENVSEDRINNEMKSDDTIGVTIYKDFKILLLKNQSNILRTLRHELTHVWLYEYGHNQQDRQFNNEDVCEIVANCFDFIDKIVKIYNNNQGDKT